MSTTTAGDGDYTTLICAILPANEDVLKWEIDAKKTKL